MEARVEPQLIVVSMVTSEEKKCKKQVISVNNFIRPVDYYCELSFGYIRGNGIHLFKRNIV